MSFDPDALDRVDPRIEELEGVRDDLLDLLTHVVNGHTFTSRDDVALVQLDADVFAEIRDRVERTRPERN